MNLDPNITFMSVVASATVIIAMGMFCRTLLRIFNVLTVDDTPGYVPDLYTKPQPPNVRPEPPMPHKK